MIFYYQFFNSNCTIHGKQKKAKLQVKDHIKTYIYIIFQSYFVSTEYFAFCQYLTHYLKNLLIQLAYFVFISERS